MTTPYLSIVIVGRNDDYGVNFIERMNIFIRSLDYQVKKHPSDFLELIIVEWNPLPDRAPLKDVILIPKNYTVRVITVPPKIHSSLDDIYGPVLEFYGKNVGIRRAQGEFILVSNPDILFTQQLIDFIAKKDLDYGTVIYRADRYDYHGEGIENCTEEQYIPFALKNTFQVHTHPETIPVTNNSSLFSLEKTQDTDNVRRSIATNASGDFILSHRNNFYKAYGLAWESSVSRGHVDSFSMVRLFDIAKINQQQIFTSPFCIFHMDHSRKPNDITWDPDLARKVTGWAGWFAQPSWFQDNWGLADCKFDEWTNK